MLPFLKSLNIGHTWLQPALKLLDALIAVVNGLTGASWYPVRVLTAAGLAANAWTVGGGNPGTKTATANGKLTVDGVDLQRGDTFWDKNDATGLRRGKFVVVDAGSATTPWIVKRSSDADTSGKFATGKKVAVAEGVANAGELLALSNGAFVLNTDTPALVAVAEMDTTTDQTITGAKSFAASALRVWNGATTFASRFTSAATATRTVTFPDASGTVVFLTAFQILIGAGAISVSTRTTRTTTGGAADALTLADGTSDGQRKSVVMGVQTAPGQTSVITPAHLQDGATITLTNTLDSVELEWSVFLTAWFVVGLGGTAVVA